MVAGNKDIVGELEVIVADGQLVEIHEKDIESEIRIEDLVVADLHVISKVAEKDCCIAGAPDPAVLERQIGVSRSKIDDGIEAAEASIQIDIAIPDDGVLAIGGVVLDTIVGVPDAGIHHGHIAGNTDRAGVGLIDIAILNQDLRIIGSALIEDLAAPAVDGDIADDQVVHRAGTEAEDDTLVRDIPFLEVVVGIVPSILAAGSGVAAHFQILPDNVVELGRHAGLVHHEQASP